MNNIATKSKKNIRVVLPGAKERNISKAKKPCSLTWDDFGKTDDVDVRNMSVTSYIAQHSTRRNKGNFVLHVWNDIAPMLSETDRKHVRGPPNERRFGCRNKKLLSTLIDHDHLPRIKRTPPQIEVSENNQIQQDEDHFSSVSSITPPRSPTPSVNTEMNRKSALSLPVVKYQRPQVATKKKLLRYSDVPLLRRQIRELSANQQKQKFREDFARTSHDIYRLKLNRPEITRGRFRDACFTYLSTSPGGMSAVSGQFA